jgi:NADH-quinone oxidoreductase subunit F
MILFPEARPTHHETYQEYCATGGYEPISRNILEEVAASGLRGRGGAGFPVGRKWAIAAETQADARYVVCNGGEDEPGSFKDRMLLEYRPHLVLEGVILAARAIGAERAFLYLNETYETALSRMKTAIGEAQVEGRLHGVTISIQRAPTVYVAGEDSAAVEVIEGKPPKPRPKPPYPAAAGLFAKPTVVNNVETLANIPSIARNGAAWFRTHGTPEHPGGMIFCLADEMTRPGAYELPFGTPLRTLYETLGGGLADGRKLKAILPGGPSCAFLTADHLDVALDPESLKNVGSSLGCGVMRFYGEGDCMVAETLRIAQFFARECCGQCPACRMETSMLSTMLERIHLGKGDAALFDQFQKIIDFNRGKGYCALIHMPAPPIMSALRLFRDEFEFHLRHGRCA